MGLVDAGGAAPGADEFVALEQLIPRVRPTEVARLLLLVLLLLGVVVVVARRVLRLNITDTRMAGVVVRGGCFLLHRPGCVGCVEASFYARAARSFSSCLEEAPCSNAQVRVLVQPSRRLLGLIYVWVGVRGLSSS